MMMYPAYTRTDSYADPKTKEMKMDFSPIYQPWPYGGNYSYPLPPPHGCCNHSCYGGPYSFHPHYTHYPPPPPPPLPFHPYGLYPPYPGPYSVPPQHYSVEHPRYEYDKNIQSPHRCFVCNHQEDDKKPRIEEESQLDKKTTDSLAPLLLKDCPDHPIMWSNNTEPKSNQKNSNNDPVLVKHLEPSKRAGNGEMVYDEQGNRFPFKIFWLPSKSEMGKDTRLLNEEKKNPESNVEKTDNGSKNSVQKVIPVKQVSADDEKKKLKSTEMKLNLEPVEKAVNGSSKGSPKTSKLPPVCLRIDPLPKKKRSSRSPSPDEKGRSNRSSADNLESSQKQEQVLKKSHEEQGEDNMITVDHSGKVQKGNGDGSDTGKVEKKSLSEHEASLIIQSAYRGFGVRKSQPLKKLRQIYEVRKQVFELRDRIQDLESSYSSSTACIDGKKEVIIGETIMNLLLKLDTIQGLHPFVREVRKSVAKELVGLQEKLDSLTSIKSKTPNLEKDVNFIKDKSDEGQVQSSLCDNYEQKATESQHDDDLPEACTAPIIDQQPEKITATEDKLDQAPTESDSVMCEACTAPAPHLDKQPEEITAGEDKLDQAQTESGSVVGKVEATESQEVANSINEPELESYNEKLEQAPTESEGLVLYEEHACEDGDCEEDDDMKIEDSSQQLSEKQVQSSIGAECSRNMETVMNDYNSECCEMDDSGAETVVLCEQGDGEMNEVMSVVEKKEEEDAAKKIQIEAGTSEKPKLPEEEEDVAKEDKLVEEAADMKDETENGENAAVAKEEENEKAVRVAIEGMMKEQLEVIRELTGRVKDLEKKLSKRNKKKKVKVNKGVRDCVVQKDWMDS